MGTGGVIDAQLFLLNEMIQGVNKFVIDTTKITDAQITLLSERLDNIESRLEAIEKKLEES